MAQASDMRYLVGEDYIARYVHNLRGVSMMDQLEELPAAKAHDDIRANTDYMVGAPSRLRQHASQVDTSRTCSSVRGSFGHSELAPGLKAYVLRL